MRLQELARCSDTSPASIKYYLREGLLPQGRAVTATLADYDESHVQRLHLISGLRGIVGLSIDAIRALVRDIDDPTRALYDVLGHAQYLTLGLTHDDRPDVEPEKVTRLLKRRGWTHAPGVRAALAAHVEGMERLGIELSDEVLDAYADAADVVASVDLGPTTSAASRDEAVLHTAVGVRSQGRLLMGLVAVAQAAHARSELGPGVDIPHAGGSPDKTCERPDAGSGSPSATRSRAVTGGK